MNMRLKDVSIIFHNKSDINNGIFDQVWYRMHVIINDPIYNPIYFENNKMVIRKVQNGIGVSNPIEVLISSEREFDET